MAWEYKYTAEQLASKRDELQTYADLGLIYIDEFDKMCRLLLKEV